MSVMQGWSGFPFLAKPVYMYIVHRVCTNIQVEVDNIPDAISKFAIDKVNLYPLYIMLLSCSKDSKL